MLKSWKAFIFRGLRPWPPDQGLCPWIPLGAPPQTPVIGSRSALALAPFLGSLNLNRLKNELLQSSPHINQSLHQILHGALFLNFTDFKKHLTVFTKSLWHIVSLWWYLAPPDDNIFKRLYLNSSCCIKTDSGLTEITNCIGTGIRQGCVLLPFLF